MRISKENISTILSRSILLGLSFLVVIITSRLWGAEGRGEISLIMADIALIMIISNIASSSGISYYIPVYGLSRLLMPSIIFGVLLALAGSLIFSFLHGFRYFFNLSIISVLNTLTTIIIAYAIGRRNILLYNVMLILPVVFSLAAILFLYFIMNIKQVEIYFYSLYFAHGLILLVAIIVFLISKENRKISFDTEIIRKMFSYGFKNELSTFLNLLSNRLSYYLIAMMMGLKILGIFSVSIALAEAFWIISKSLSIVQYSTIINEKDKQKNIQITQNNVKLSVFITCIVILIFLACPQWVFTSIFGDEFEGVKKTTLILIPGVLAVAASNLYGHYFSATGHMRILIYKSLAGLLIMAVLSLILIPRFKLVGACIATNLSFITASTYLFIAFQRVKKTEMIKENPWNSKMS